MFLSVSETTRIVYVIQNPEYFAQEKNIYIYHLISKN